MYTLEVCVDSVASAINAVKGGANRLELCSNIIIGGTSPSLALFHEIRQVMEIPIHVLLRPRFGDFCYDQWELEILYREVSMFRDAGAEGVVIGVLKPDGSLDIKVMKKLIDLAGPMHITLHRAFDVCHDSYATLQVAKTIGIHTILTSGQANTCLEGLDLIASLVHEAGDDLEIMVGSGVTGSIIKQIYEHTKAKAYHMTGKKIRYSAMTYRNESIHMGLNEFNEYTIFETDEHQIDLAAKVVLAMED